MIAKIIKYTILALVLALGGGIAFSPNFRGELRIMSAALTNNSVAKLEAQLDQGELALLRYDEAKNKAEKRLSTMLRTQRDLQMNIARKQEKVADYREQGREDLAMRNEEQINIMQQQLEMFSKSTEKLKSSLERISLIRSRAREDVQLVRERIAILSTAKEALDDQGMIELLEKAEQNVTSLQNQCNKLAAEVEVLNMDE